MVRKICAVQRIESKIQQLTITVAHDTDKVHTNMNDFIYAMAASGLLYDLAQECEPTELQDLIDIGYDGYRNRTSQVEEKSL